MEMLAHNLSEVFAVSILHSIWQCLLIYLVLRIVLADVIPLSASTKHNMVMTGMLVSFAWFAYTLFDQAENYTWHFTGQTSGGIGQHLPLITSINHLTGNGNDFIELSVNRYLPYVTIVYILGLLFNSLKLLFGWLQLRQLKLTANTDYHWQQKLNGLSALLRIKNIVSILCTDKIDVPCITGYLKPVILIPISLTTYLSVKEVEAILLHELAHVKRNDYLLNLLQQAISVILFFNPFIYLINRMINQERENSCDDTVVAITGTPLVYAQALLKIEQQKAQQFQLALSATGSNKFYLLNRIERIMKTTKPMVNIRHVVMAFTILAITLTGITWFNPAIGNGRVSIRKVVPALKNLISTDTTIKKTTKGSGKTHPKTSVHTSTSRHTYYQGMEVHGFNDPELERLTAEVNKRGEAINKYYSSQDFKDLQEQMQKAGTEMQSFFNNDKLKELQERQEKSGLEFQEKWGDNTEAEAIGKKMQRQGDIMNKYYSSQEFKDLYKRLQKKYGIPDNYISSKDDRDIKNENYRKYREEMKKNIPAEVTDASEEMKKLGDQMRNYYNSPEYKAALDQLKASADSLKIAYRNPKVKQQQEEIKKLGDKMRQYQNNAEIKRQQELLREASDKLRAYTNTPEFKKKVERWKSEHLTFEDLPEAKEPTLPTPPEVIATPPPTPPLK